MFWFGERGGGIVIILFWVIAGRVRVRGAVKLLCIRLYYLFRGYFRRGSYFTLRVLGATGFEEGAD